MRGGLISNIGTIIVGVFIVIAASGLIPELDYKIPMFGVIAGGVITVAGGCYDFYKSRN